LKLYLLARILLMYLLTYLDALCCDQVDRVSIAWRPLRSAGRTTRPITHVTASLNTSQPHRGSEMVCLHTAHRR